MMDAIVPGGVARDIALEGTEHVKTLLAEVRRIFPRLIELHDNTASLQDRTVTTGIVRPELAQQFGAGGYVGRASSRAFDARRVLTYAPYDKLSFEVPVLATGDVNARVWIRIREIEQSLSLIEQILAAAPSGEIKATIGKTTSCEGLGVAEAFRGDVLVWLKLDGKGRVARAICGTPPGSSGPYWKQRSRAILSPTFHSATNRSTALIPDMTPSDAQDTV